MKKLILVLAYLLLAVPCGARIITVDDDGPADFDNIQAAIDDANDGDTIIVADGTYTGFGNCCIDFLGKAITVRSTDPNDPNIVAETVISCYGTFYEFWFHTAEGPNSVLAGVTIINASQFAAIYCDNASPTITNCTITGYSPFYHGNGIVCDYSSSPTITNCTITDNTARGIVCWYNSNPTISSCKISNNGGGIFCSYEYVPSSAPIVTDCTIKANAAYLSSAHDYGCGGGIAGSEGPITNCTITSNTAGGGGGLYKCSGPITGCIISDNSTEGDGGGLYECNGPITNCIITGNSAGERGGGIFVCNGPITNCIITGNSAGEHGGGIFRCDSTVANCIITGNTAGADGGGMFGCDTIKNCTITGNFAEDHGGGVDSGDEITNCIIWNNWPEQIGCCPDITYSNIQGSWPGEGNIDADPCFAFSTDYHTMPSSPCINAGDPDYIPEPNETDLDGNPRVNGSRIDIGAYEYAPNSPSIAVSAWSLYFTQDWPKPEPQTLLIRNAASETLHWEIAEDCNWLQVSSTNGVSTGQIEEVILTVDPNGFAPGLYSYDLSVQDPNASNNPVTVNVTMPVGQVLPVPSQDFNTIQDAIDAADNYDIVLVADGNYTGEGNRNLDFREKPITVCSENGPNNCIINCENSGRGFYLHNNKGTDAILKGFTITNGSDSGGGAVYCEGIKFVSRPIITKCNIVGNSTRGILCHDSSPLITNCTITNNSAKYDGGGIYCWGSSPIISYCTITNNSAEDVGGGICGCDGPITNCTISGNTAGDDGGGLSYCGGPITNCTISGNTAGDSGGGISECKGPITNCTISGNTAGDDGGGMFCGGMFYCGGPITNCTITGNSASRGGGGMYNFGRCSPTITNCTFSRNSAYEGGGMYNGSSSPMMTNCTFSGNSAGEQGGGIYNYNWCKPTLTNCTFFGNSAPNGNACACNSYTQSRPSTVQLANCIVWDGGQVIWNNDVSTITISYTDLQGGQAACYDPCNAIEWGLGNIDADPRFIEPGYWADANDANIIVEPNDPNAVWINGDYHLKSEGWSWDTKRSRWTYDDVTSRCIDAGNPGCPFGDELLSTPDDPNNIWGQNLRINMGTFGGTAEASMPPYDWALLGDLTNDGKVDLNDLTAFVNYWLDSGECIPSDLDRSQFVDMFDFAPLAQDWLGQTTWHE